MAVEADGEPAGHVGITHAAERERPHVRIPGRAHLWMLFVRPPWWGTGLAARLHRLGARGGGAPGLRDDPALHAARRRPRARLLRARGLGARRAAPFAEPLLGLDLVEYRRGAVIPERLFEDAAERSRVSMRTRWDRVRMGWRVMVQAGVAVALAWAVAKWLLGPQGAVLRAGLGDHRARHELPRARPAGGRARRRGHARDRRRPTCSPSSSAPASSQLALAVFIAIGLGLFFGTSQLFVNQVAVSAVLVFTVPTAGSHVSVRARARRADRRRRSRWPSPRSCCRPTRCGCCATPRGRCSTSSRGRCDDIAGALRTRDPDAAEAALVRARGIDELGERFFDATLEGRETTRISPARRRARGHGRVLRRGGGADRPRGPQRPRARPRRDAGAGARRERAAGGRRRARAISPTAVRALGGALETRRGLRRRARARAARRRDRDARARGHDEPVRVSVIVGQIRSTATDLLTGIGLSYEEATEAVREARSYDLLAGRAPERRPAADRRALDASSRSAGSARRACGTG